MAAGPKRRATWALESVALATEIDRRLPADEALFAEAKKLSLKTNLGEVKQKRSAYCAAAYHHIAPLLKKQKYQLIKFHGDFRALTEKKLLVDPSVLKMTT
jgi:hypothetical protein